MVIDKLAWLRVEDGRVLSTRSHGKDRYYIPGGKRELGESDEEALVREIREELCVELIPSTMEFVGTFEALAHGKTGGTIVKMTCYSADYTGEVRPASEIAEVVWLGYDGRKYSSAVDQIIFDWLRDHGQI